MIFDCEWDFSCVRDVAGRQAGVSRRVRWLSWKSETPAAQVTDGEDMRFGRTFYFE